MVTDDIFTLMHRARREIEVSAQMLMWHYSKVDAATRREWERDVWAMGTFEPEKDKVGKELVEFRQRTEDLCRPIVDRGFRRLARHSLLPRSWPRIFWWRDDARED